MTHALLAAKSGWGKSWYTQVYAEANLEDVDYAVVLDFKDEYRGLAKSGFAKWMGVGDREARLGTAAWTKALRSNRRLILARHDLQPDEWRDVAANVVRALRELDGTGLVVIDESHFIAPQSGGYPDAIEGLATTGRGEGVSSLWVTQRLARLDETVIAQMMVRILGGFASDADLSKVASVVEYPADVHNVAKQSAGHLPPELRVDDSSPTLRKFTENGRTVGSEWIRSDDTGDVERVDTREKSMTSTHYSPEGHSLRDP